MKEIVIPEPELIDTKELKTDGDNPNAMTEEQLEALKRNIQRFGFLVPIVTNDELLVADGEHRLKAAEALGLAKVPVVRLPVSDVDRRVIRQVMNKLRGSHDLKLDVEEFKKVLQADGDFQRLAELMAVDESEFSRLIKKVEFVAKTGDDDVPEVEEPFVKPGELWVLGEHRVLCGDATKKRDYALLTGEKNADLLFTDPPYNLGVQYNHYDDNKERNDYFAWCKKWFENIVTKRKIMTVGKQNIDLWFKIAKITDIGVWIAKNKMSGGKISNLSLWEPILFFGEFDRSKRTTDIFEYNNSLQKDTQGHPCPKQVKLIEDIITNYSESGETIIDVFGGSGTTLIACEKTQRRCFMMEIDPHYCSIIIKRWEEYTGKKAVKQ